MAEFEPHFEEAIVTPHEHETPLNPPLWIIWQIVTSNDGVQDFPAIDSINNSEHAARYNLAAMLETASTMGAKSVRVYVERIPANHRFASSLSDLFHDASLTTVRSIDRWRKTWSYKHEGD